MTTIKIPHAVEMAGAPQLREAIPGKRILVVDDEPLIRLLNFDILANAGFQVDTAEDGAAAWEAMQLNDYDLLVTDNQMPKVCGVELVEKIRVAGMGLPVIMATATLPDETFTGRPWLQPFAMLLKPYSLAEFLGAVKSTLGATKLDGAAAVLVPNWESNPQAFGLRL